MAYQKSVQRVLGTGINLRVRPTELPDHKAQKMTNCSLDMDGSIKSRKGHSLICNASGRVHRMINALGARWTATAAAVDKDCTALIDVQSADLVAFKDFVWAGRTKMRKSDGTHDWRWIPEAPTEAPTIETAEEVVTLIDDFSEGWSKDTDITIDEDGNRRDEDGNLLDEFGNPVDEDGNPIDPGFAYDDDGLKIVGTAGRVYSFTKAVSAEGEEALNLYDGYDLDDLFRIRLKAKKWSAIAGVSFDIDVNDGSFKTDYYKVRMPLKEILAGKRETITFYIRKRHLAVDDAAANKNLWGAFERIGQTTEKDWRSVVALRAKVEFVEQTKFWFSHWELVGNEDNTLEGDDFGVYYTYTTAAGHESNPSPKSKLITVNHGSIDVTDLVPSADPQVTAMNFYLTGGTLGAVYRVNADPVPQTLEYTIIQSANDLTDLNIQLEDDHDDPPAADGIAGPYFGRILAWKGRRYYWTHQNKPYAFSNPDGPDGAWADVDESAGDIKYISVRPNQAWIYCENDIYLLDGDPADFLGITQSTNTKMGTPARNGVTQAGPADIAFLTSGIYIVDTSGAPRKISAELEPLFQNLPVRLWDGTDVPLVFDPPSVALGYENGIVRFSHSGGTFNYSIALDRWVQDSRLFTAFQSEGEAGILAGQANGAVLMLEDTETDDGQPIEIDFLSKAYDCGIHDNEKRLEDVTTYYVALNNTLTQTVYYLPEAGLSTTLTGFSRRRNVQQLNDGQGIRGRNFAIQIVGDTIAETIIEAFDLNFYAEAREAKSYDTAVTDANTHHVKLIRELQADIENDNGMTVTLETDVPGFALTSREVHSIGTNLFRRTEPIVMDDEVYGHNFRIVMSGAGYFRAFRARALVQAIPHYLHGQKGEYYLSDPVDWNQERVKMAREIEIVYRTVGTAQVYLYSDMLSGGLKFPCATFNLTQSLSERPAKLRLTGLIYARLFQLRIEPSVDFRLEAARIRLKAIGEPNATMWTWVDFPLQPTQDAIWHNLEFTQDQVA